MLFVSCWCLFLVALPNWAKPTLIVSFFFFILFKNTSLFLSLLFFLSLSSIYSLHSLPLTLFITPSTSPLSPLPFLFLLYHSYFIIFIDLKKHWWVGTTLPEPMPHPSPPVPSLPLSGILPLLLVCLSFSLFFHLFLHSLLFPSFILPWLFFINFLIIIRLSKMGEWM